MIKSLWKRDNLYLYVRVMFRLTTFCKILRACTEGSLRTWSTDRYTSHCNFVSQNGDMLQQDIHHKVILKLIKLSIYSLLWRLAQICHVFMSCSNFSGTIWPTRIKLYIHILWKLAKVKSYNSTSLKMPESHNLKNY